MVGLATRPSGLSPFPRTGGFLAAAASLTDPAVTQPEQKHAPTKIRCALMPLTALGFGAAVMPRTYDWAGRPLVPRTVRPIAKRV